VDFFRRKSCISSRYFPRVRTISSPGFVSSSATEHYFRLGSLISNSRTFFPLQLVSDMLTKSGRWLRPTSCKIGPGFVQSENSNFLWVDRYKVAISKQLMRSNMHPIMVQTRAASASMVRIYGAKRLILALRSYENLSKSLNAKKLCMSSSTPSGHSKENLNIV